ncbi:hypothetical protein ACH0BF_16440 [Pseudobacillus sp. 179-B 2D1 NHS]|uniref:hypothetical protein n=1 Tax=Pseudobacillus sp. 179-B 2D1 NHS TaxID=3374292 RepID=UPI0038796664
MDEKTNTVNESWDLFSAFSIQENMENEKLIKVDIEAIDPVIRSEMKKRSCLVEVNDLVVVLDATDYSVESAAYCSRFIKKKGMVTEIKEVLYPSDEEHRYNVFVKFETLDEVGIFYDTELGVI